MEELRMLDRGREMMNLEVLRGREGILSRPEAEVLLREAELTFEGNCVLWGMRVVVPQSLQGRVLEELHSTHAGMSQMKCVTRSSVWWPKLDKHIEDLVRSFLSCQSNQDSLAVALLQLWAWPVKPWQYIHIDVARPFLGNMFLLDCVLD